MDVAFVYVYGVCLSVCYGFGFEKYEYFENISNAEWTMKKTKNE